MIYQCYFAEAHRSRLFQLPLYSGFGLEPEVNPDIAKNCPELEDPSSRALLCEYAAMLHLWRNSFLADPHGWVGFTSYRQLDKVQTIFTDEQIIIEGLTSYDILGWGFLEFFDGPSQQPVSVAWQGEVCHPGLSEMLNRILSLTNENIPRQYLNDNVGLFCNYWIMSKANFEEYMNWSYPLVQWALQHNPYYTSDRRAVSYIAERLFIIWYMLKHKSLCNVGQVVRVEKWLRMPTPLEDGAILWVEAARGSAPRQVPRLGEVFVNGPD
jgi:hypothetical protein